MFWAPTGAHAGKPSTRCVITSTCSSVSVGFRHVCLILCSPYICSSCPGRSVLLSEQPVHPGVPQQLPATVVAQQSVHQLLPSPVQQLPAATARSHQPSHPVSWQRAAQGSDQAAFSHHVPLTVPHHTGTPWRPSGFLEPVSMKVC